MVEDGADEKLQREVEEQLKYAELERMVMQLEDESGDMQVNSKISDLIVSNQLKLLVQAGTYQIASTRTKVKFRCLTNFNG